MSPPRGPSPRSIGFEPNPSPPAVDRTSNNFTIGGLAVGVGVGSVVVLVLVAIFFFWYKKHLRAKVRDGNGGTHERWNLSSFHRLSFSEEDILAAMSYQKLGIATGGFSESTVIGRGGFGNVYKAILKSGKTVAVKRFKTESKQGDREFEAEIATIRRVHHKHIVSLVGYCKHGLHKLLVYEFVPNNSLHFHLHGNGNGLLNWATRMKIALGSAKGLAYLHEECQPKIIHRDIKSANILLDSNFEPKLGDFGLARLTSETNSHVSTGVMGTFGYLAPEYASTGRLTEKSDVFSFGVVLIELITGRQPIDKTQSSFYNIVDWARPLLSKTFEDANFSTMVDTRLKSNFDCTEISRMIKCAAACVHHLASQRPSMSQVVRTLEGNLSLEELDNAIKTGHNKSNSSHESSDFDATHYGKDLEKLRKMAFENQNNSIGWGASNSNCN